MYFKKLTCFQFLGILHLFTAISDHIANCVKCKNEKLTVQNFKVLKECNNKLETTINEAILIKKYNPSLNKQLMKPGITHNLRIFD